jgi:DNA mismatch repair protein MutS
VVFLHEVAEGAAGRSWGVHVAELAGVPKSVVRRAASLLSALEKQSGPLAAGGVLGALPLFAAAESPDEDKEDAPPDDELRNALALLDPDRLTPREALDALYRLRALLPAPAGDEK